MGDSACHNVTLSLGLSELRLKLLMSVIPGDVIIMLLKEVVLCSHYAQLGIQPLTQGPTYVSVFGTIIIFDI